MRHVYLQETIPKGRNAALYGAACKEVAGLSMITRS
jgi:hypothetical protein